MSEQPKQPDRWTKIAHDVEDFLIELEAVRNPATGEIKAYYTVRQLADALGFWVGDWVNIKEKMLQLGMTICYTPKLGHYLGLPGEQAKNIYYADRQVQGWKLRVQKYLTKINLKEQAQFLEENYGADFNQILEEYGDKDEIHNKEVNDRRAEDTRRRRRADHSTD